MKPTLKKILLVVAALVVLAIAGVALAVALIDVDGMINAEIAKRKPEIEKQLGRSVETGKVTTTLFPTLGGKIEQVKVAADPAHPEDDEPLLEVGSLGFELALWDAIVSGGKRITLKAIYLDGLRVSVVRYKGGRLSYEDITERQERSSEEPAEEAPSEEPSPEVQQRIADLRIDEIRMADARFRLVDHDTPTGEKAESLIQRFNVRIRDVRAGQPIAIHVDAAVFSDAKNFELDTVLGPVSAALKTSETAPIRHLTLKMNAIDLSRLAPYVAEDGAAITSTLASADWRVGEISPGKPVAVSGFIELKNVRLGEGKPFDTRLDSDLDVFPDTVGLDIRKLEFSLGAAKFIASGALSELTRKPSFKDFKVRSEGFNPEALLAHFPELKASLEPGTRVAGDVGIELTASGDAAKQTLQAKVDLTPVEVFAPGALRKPAGTPMRMSVDGDFTSADATFRRLGFVLDELDVSVTGTVKNFASPTFDLALASPPFSLDRLARLLPSLHAQLEASKTQAQGEGAIQGKFKGTTKDLDAAFELALTGMKLQVPSTHLEGDLRLTATAKGDPSANFEAKASFDADAATIRMEDTLDKKAGVPMRFTADIGATPERWEIRQFDVKLASLSASARGGVDRNTNQVAIDAKLEPLDLERLAVTVTSIPKAYAKNGKVSFAAKVTGNAEDSNTLTVALSDFVAQLGRSDLKGSMTMKGLSSPDVKMQLTSNFLDVDELYPPKEDKEGGAEGADADADADADDPELKEYAFVGDFSAKRMLYRKDDYSNVRCAMTMREGSVTLDTCTLNVYGGSVDASGSSAEIWRGKMPYKAKLQIKDVELDRALASKTKYGGLIQGKTNLAVNLSGKGFETADLEQFLSGNVDLGMAEGRLVKANLTESVAGHVAKLGKMSAAQKVSTAGAIRDLAAQFVVKDGKLELVKPVKTSVDGNTLQVGGAIGIAGKLALQGTYFMSAKSLGSMTGGRCSGEGEIAIPLKIEGAASAPSYGLEGGALATEIASRCLSGALGNALKDKLGIDVPTSAADAKNLLKEKAAAKQAELEAQARAKAQAESDQLKAEAAKKAAEQKKKAEEAAKKKAKGALEGFFK